MNNYEEGYRDGMQHVASQVDYINDQVAKVAQILTKAVFVYNTETHQPKPSTRIWMILGEDIITTGYFLAGKYLSDGGSYVSPTHWCLPPTAIATDLANRLSIVKPKP